MTGNLGKSLFFSGSLEPARWPETTIEKFLRNIWTFLIFLEKCHREFERIFKISIFLASTNENFGNRLKRVLAQNDIKSNIATL